MNSNAPITTPPVDPTKQNQYLALGDSYTIGQSVPERDRFPNQTRDQLTDYGINMGAPQYIATTGWTTSDLRTAIAARNPVGPFDVVSLLIGVNDQYQMNDTIGYRVRFTFLLNKAIELAGNKRDHVFVISIPDYSVTPFAMSLDTAAIRKQLDWFNAINKEVTLQNLCPYLDITPSSREARYDNTLIAPDGLHPSGKEYLKWSLKLAAMMKPVLQ